MWISDPEDQSVFTVCSLKACRNIQELFHFCRTLSRVVCSRLCRNQSSTQVNQGEEALLLQNYSWPWALWSPSCLDNFIFSVWHRIYLYKHDLWMTILMNWSHLHGLLIQLELFFSRSVFVLFRSADSFDLFQTLHVKAPATEKKTYVGVFFFLFLCSAGQFPRDGPARPPAGDRRHGADPGEMWRWSMISFSEFIRNETEAAAFVWEVKWKHFITSFRNSFCFLFLKTQLQCLFIKICFLSKSVSFYW